MATFPSIAARYGANKASSPNLKAVQFGDGYAQFISQGINQNPKEWRLQWSLSETDSDTIETFLNARALDGETFTWTPPDESTAYKWRCLSWSKAITYNNRSEINATFIQFFEP